MDCKSAMFLSSRRTHYRIVCNYTPERHRRRSVITYVLPVARRMRSTPSLSIRRITSASTAAAAVPLYNACSSHPFATVFFSLSSLCTSVSAFVCLSGCFYTHVLPVSWRAVNGFCGRSVAMVTRPLSPRLMRRRRHHWLPSSFVRALRVVSQPRSQWVPVVSSSGWKNEAIVSGDPWKRRQVGPGNGSLSIIILGESRTAV